MLTTLFAKVAALNPTAFPAWEALRRATIEGAQAVTLGDEVRSLEAGKVLVRDGKVRIADETAIRAEVQVQAQEVARRVAVDPVHKEMALLRAMEAGCL